MNTQSLPIATLLVLGMLSSTLHAAQGTVNGSNVTLTSGSITNNHMAPNSIRGGNVEDGSLRGNDLANDSIYNTQIAENAVGASELGNASVDNAALQEGAVSTNKLANNAVTTGKIADGSILGADIQLGTITNAHIADNSVGMTKLSADVQHSLQRINGLEREINRGDAMAMAINSVPHLSNKTHSFGLGSARVGSTDAISASYQFNNQANFAASIGAAFSEGDKAVAAGVAWGF